MKNTLKILLALMIITLYNGSFAYSDEEIINMDSTIRNGVGNSLELDNVIIKDYIYNGGTCDRDRVNGDYIIKGLGKYSYEHRGLEIKYDTNGNILNYYGLNTMDYFNNNPIRDLDTEISTNPVYQNNKLLIKKYKEIINTIDLYGSFKQDIQGSDGTIRSVYVTKDSLEYQVDTNLINRYTQENKYIYDKLDKEINLWNNERQKMLSNYYNNISNMCTSNKVEYEKKLKDGSIKKNNVEKTQTESKNKNQAIYDKLELFETKKPGTLKKILPQLEKLANKQSNQAKKDLINDIINYINSKH